MDTQAKIVKPNGNGYTGDELAPHLAKLDKPIVFTNGCFDILHRGHISYLEEARNLGGSLIVAANSDHSVKRQNKDPNRPINSIEDRMAILASLACVDLVLSFDEDTPLNLINQILPDHLVKGGDWQIKDIVGGKEVVKNGGQVHSLEFQFQRSTTALVNKIRSF
ncbi:MAG: D-glycero-beta-D-manno-heptose 1-phosphate adenylyltransferase [Acidiferrobacterales bacterium]|nr:D-glycero-beta-D-manno-heptose 1-phosphate adenylyltransferase [Acidiferrobacterales bacterium]